MIILEPTTLTKTASLYISCGSYTYEVHGFVVNIVLSEVALFLYFIEGNVCIYSVELYNESGIDRCWLSSQHWPSHYMSANKGF